MSGVNDLQIDGTADDGSAEGYKKTRLQESGLILMPFEQNGILLAGTNSGWSRTYSENPDGSYSGVLFTIAAGNTTPGVLQWRCRGKAVGLRWNAGYMASLKSLGVFSLKVDNRDYLINPYSLISDTGVAESLTYNQRQFVVHDLPDTDHLCRLLVQAPPAGSPNTGLRVYGYLVDKAAGYLEPQRIGVLETSYLLTNGFVLVRAALDAGIAVQMRPRGIRSIYFYNTDTSARVVQIASGTIGNVIWEIPLGAAGATTAPLACAVFPPVGDHAWAGNLGDWDSIWLKADVGAKVNVTINKES